MAYYFTRNPGQEHLRVDEKLRRLQIAGTLENGTPATGHIDYEVQNGRPVLTTILSNPDGEGLGAILLYCYALHSIKVHNAEIVGLALPGFDVANVYSRFGFIQDVEAVQQAIDTADNSLTSDELRQAVRGYPMVADTRTLMQEAQASYTGKRWAFVRQD